MSRSGLYGPGGTGYSWPSWVADQVNALFRTFDTVTESLGLKADKTDLDTVTASLGLKADQVALDAEVARATAAEATAVVTTAGASQVIRRHTYFLSGRPWVDFLGLVGENQADYGAKLAEVIADPAAGTKFFLPPFSYPWLSGCDIDQSNVMVEMRPGTELQVPSGYSSYVFRVKNPAAGAVTVSRVNVRGGKVIELGALAERLNLWDYVRLHATTKGISWCRFRDTDVWYPGRMIVLKNDAVAAGFINSNKFTDMEALNPRTAVVDFEDDPASGGANRNSFVNVDGQAADFTQHGYRNIGRRSNHFGNCTLFDANQNPAAISATIAATAEETVIISGAMTQQNFVDNGVRTILMTAETRYNNVGGVLVQEVGTNRPEIKGGFAVRVGGLELDNGQYLRWRDAAGALLNVLRLTSGDVLEMVAPANLVLRAVGNTELWAGGSRRARIMSTGNLQMEAGSHVRLAQDPANVLDAAPKQYADTKAPIASPTFTGSVTLPGDPGSALHAATKQYVDAAAGVVPTRFRTSADQAVVDATLVDLTGLGPAVLANSTYEFDITVLFDTTTANDAKFAVTFPAGATIAWYGLGPASTATTQNANGNYDVITSGGSSSYGGTRATGAGARRTFINIRGRLVTSGTAGTLQVRAAKLANTDTASPADDLTIYAGSGGQILKTA